MDITGFIFTIIGTVAGIVSLYITIIINRNTNDIKKNIKIHEVKTTFKISRESILNKLNKTYGEYKSNIDGVKIYEIKEILVDLKQYEELYDGEMIKILEDISDDVTSCSKRNNPSRVKTEKLMVNVYKLIRLLESDIKVMKRDI
jgi:hypothetical protein